MDTPVFDAVLLREPGRLSALCLDVDVASSARTPALAKKRLAEAVRGYVETALAGNLPVPRPVPPDENPVLKSPEDVVERFAIRVRLSVSVEATDAKAPPADERVARLETPEECDQFALNVQDRLPDLARGARRRAVELRAASHGAKTAAEQEALAAVYAYERVLSERRGRTVRATRTWQMIARHGIIGAVERAVNRPVDPVGYTALAEMGMQDLAFETVVLRHRDLFSPEAVARSSERLRDWRRRKDQEQ